MALAPPDMLCFALHSAAQAVHGAYAPLLDPLGLTYPQYLVIASLAQQDGQGMGQLGAQLRLESNTLTPMLQRMEGAGWITRSRDPDDDRKVKVRLTEAGLTLAASAAHVPRAFVQKTGLEMSQVQDLRDVLAILRDRLKPGKA